MFNQNLSINRLLAVIGVAIITSSALEAQRAFQAPLPDTAGLEEVVLRVRQASVNSLNAMVPAILSALVGFFVRADKTMPLLSTSKVDK